ncbi:hypothetical protein SDC9_57001 [bioreactor metagenome]|uniref:Uncharacterized protein n=1 Tax=bioreactor metagenome TaxID=1076179 RepID=A0A644X3X4_9ZZZZ
MNVSQFVRINASPKQPQSPTASVIASHNVKGVKMAMNAAADHTLSFGLMPNRNAAPIRNSAALSNMAKVSASGISHSMPKAMK